NFYVDSTIIGWVTVGVLVIAIAIAIYMSAEATVAAKAMTTDTSGNITVNSETRSITTAQINRELSLPIVETPEAKALNDRIVKSSKSKGFFERLSVNQK